ncbi:hypothetical protein VOLCADRAFT_78429 [Volvox carteri f. nagariensis]|uniref:Uncharacterized protein n=1 Tax=Volvox carteri f. nagariensis TaxID=3068 RepID=D8ULY3_VOLCA|nr:uncharacterized protein VOLCADRAFT_78429 [Volvox carteri f. nagariensis]EFJ39266.1 hypothetical protein VOLCADRAFT_78429 [Volvox carteri f. nagariensis]|eukprot:XP_002959669.1 hypothetical protein VOLCADRAFT_78429 [Volvox carteri f. nagariensis]
MEAIQNVPEPSPGDLPGLQGIPVEVRDMASKIGFEIGCRPFQLFYTAYEKWKSDFKPAFNSPGSAKATMDMFSTLYEMGFRERDLLDQQQVNRVSLKTFKESVKPKMVHMVPPNFINGLEAAFEAVANPNPRKRKNSWDSQEGDGDDGEHDGTKDASGSGTSQGVQRAKRYILEKLYKFFDPVLKDFNSADEEEFEKYQSSQSHLEYLQKSLGPLNNEDDKFVFIVEGKDSPVLLAGGVVFGSLENIVHDTDKVSVFIMHRANNSKKTSMVLPSGTIKVGKELKKHMVVELPVQSLLGRFNKQQVKEWAFSHGCTNVLWNDSMVQYKGKLALVA